MNNENSNNQPPVWYSVIQKFYQCNYQVIRSYEDPSVKRPDPEALNNISRLVWRLLNWLEKICRTSENKESTKSESEVFEYLFQPALTFDAAIRYQEESKGGELEEQRNLDMFKWIKNSLEKPLKYKAENQAIETLFIKPVK